MFENVLWERDLHQRGSSTKLAVSADCVVTHERRNRLVCLDLRNGTVRWDIRFGSWPRDVVMSGDRCLAIAQDIDGLVCFDLRTGAVLWNAGLPRFTKHIAVTEDTVLVGGWRGYTPLMAFDLATGAARWTTGERCNTVLPIPVGGAFLTGADDGTGLRLLDACDGAERLRWTLPAPLATVDGNRLFTSGEAGQLLVRCGTRTVAELRPDTGQVRTLLHHDTDLAPAAAQYVGGLLWVREHRAGYAAFNPGDGSLRWRIDVGQPLMEQVVPHEAGFLLGGDHGTLLRLDAAGHITHRTSVSRRITALHPAGPAGQPDELIVVTRGTLLAMSIPAATPTEKDAA